MRIRKSDREILAYVDKRIEEGEVFDEYDAKLRKAWSSFYSRVLAEELKAAKKETGYPVRSAIEAIRGVLGKRCVVPVKPGTVWFVTLQNRINQSGLDEELIRKAARIAGKEWRGAVKAESVIRQADKLLSEYTEAAAPLDSNSKVAYMEDL